MKTRHDEMREQCIEFHNQYPEVWQMFVDFTFQMISKGYKNYSAQSVIERIRWEKDAGSDGTSAFKINNNFTAFYSRGFMRRYPQYNGFFRLRYQISNQSEATNREPLTPADFPYANKTENLQPGSIL